MPSPLPPLKPGPECGKIALVEDLRETRASLSLLLNTFTKLKCVCICASGEEALRQIPPVKPDVILMDIFFPRETELLTLLAKGHSNKEIASKLSLTLETIQSCLKSVYKKMRVHSRGQAAAKFISSQGD